MRASLAVSLFALALPVLPAQGAAAAHEIRVEPEIAMARAQAATGAKKGRGRATRSLQLGLGRPSAEELAQIGPARKGEPQKVGVGRAVEALRQGLGPALEWEQVPGGAHVASVTITSPDAAALRFGVRVDKVPEGATLRFHDAAGETLFEVPGSEIAAIVEANVASGDRSVEARTWWSPVIESETAVMEVELPFGVDTRELKVSVPAVSHLVTSASKGFMVAKAVGDSQSCHNDATCQAGAWSAQMNAVSRMLFSSGGSTYVCTGTLLADNDPTTTIPYFLTARHCIGSQTVASTLVNFWFYRSPSCNAGTLSPSAIQQAAGAGTQLLYQSSNTDVAFLRLGNTPPAGATYAGWKSSPGLSSGAAVTALHHPAGDLLKLSTGNVSSFHTCTAPNSQGQFSCSSASGGSSTFYGISWNDGVTQGGSSGSALFDSGKYVVGQLYGGGSSCSSPGTSDIYGRFDVSFAAGISQFLDPPSPPPLLTVSKAGTSSAGIVTSTPSGINCGSTCSAAFASSSTVTLSATPVAGVSTFAGWGGACAGTGTCTVTMNAARSVTATFNQDNGVAMSPVQLVFGTTQATQAVTLTNNTGAAVTFTQLASSSPRFAPAGNCGTVAAGASCTVNVTYNPAATGADSGSLTVSSTASGSPQAVALYAASADSPRFANLSTRAQAMTGDDVVIGGFIIEGTAPKRVVIRARGPSLAQFGIYNHLVNPQLQLFSGQASIAYNNDYTGASNLAQLQATGFAPSDPREAAMLVTLDPGAYTALVTGADGGTGVAIVEVFEVDRFDVPLANISTRAPVRTGNDLMIGGFIIHGNAPKTVLVRARGPSLAAFGVSNVLPNPQVQLVRSSDGATIAGNDDWKGAANAALVAATGLAPTNDRESAILITLDPGAYTALVTGVGGATGVGIVEVFAQ